MVRVGMVLVMVSVALPPAPVSAQQPGEEGGSRPGKIGLVLELGRVVGGPALGLVRQLREAGYDDTSPGGCSFFGCHDGIPHPRRNGPGGVGGLTARVSLKPSMAVALGYSSASLGGADGYRRGADVLSNAYAFSNWDALSFWVAGFWKPAPVMRLGGGPAWVRLNNSPQPIGVSRLGAVGEFGIEVPAPRSGFFLNLAVRYHHVPSADVVHGRDSERITLRPDWTHSVVSGGLGWRF